MTTIKLTLCAALLAVTVPVAGAIGLVGGAGPAVAAALLPGLALAAIALALGSRIVTITGSGVREPGNLEARLGTPISQLISECGGYTAGDRHLIMGGSMMGLAFEDDRLPIVREMGMICVSGGMCGMKYFP